MRFEEFLKIPAIPRTGDVLRIFKIVRVVVLISVVTQSGCSSASDKFEVVREVVLEPGVGSVHPASITRTPDDGYIVTGSIARKSGLAIKTDSQGNMIWRFSLPTEGDAKDNIREPNFTGAVSMKDGSTLLCGDYQKKDDTKPNKYGAFVGLMVKLDAKGKLLEKIDLFTNGDTGRELNRVHGCISWNDGIVIFGLARNYRDKSELERGYWITYLNSSGSMVWEKVIAFPMTNADGISRPRLSANGELVFSAWRGSEATEVIRLDAEGNIRARSKVDGASWMARTTDPSDPVRLVPVFNGTDTGTKTVVTLDTALHVTDQQTGPLAHNWASLAYQLRDGSLLVFGAHKDYGDDSNIVKWGPDFRRQTDEFRFDSKLKRGSYYDVIVADAVPTTTPNEFAVVRHMITGSSDSVGPGSGILLSFVRIK